MSTRSVDTSSPVFSGAVAASTAATPSTVPDITTLDKHGYLFGSNLKASLSPFLHSVIYSNLDLRWAQLPLDSLDLPLFLRLARHPDFYGASVTMPHKVAILPHLDQLTEECRQVGACNTVFVRPDPQNPDKKILCGTNTDVIGVRDSFLENVKDCSIWEGRPGLVLGGGGAARSAVYALWKWMGVTDIYIVNRDETEAKDLIRDCASKGFGDRLKYVGSVEEAKKLETPGAVVACIPDYAPSAGGEKLARRITKELMAREESKKGVMLEMCYNPTPYTRLSAIVESWGWKVILGTEALIYQGLEQDTYWTERELHKLPVEKVHEAIAEKVAERAKEAKL